MRRSKDTPAALTDFDRSSSTFAELFSLTSQLPVAQFYLEIRFTLLYYC